MKLHKISLFIQKLLNLIKECINILKFSVNGGKSYICNLVNAFKLVHRKGAYKLGRDLAVERILNARFDLIHSFFEGIY